MATKRENPETKTSKEQTNTQSETPNVAPSGVVERSAGRTPAIAVRIDRMIDYERSNVKATVSVNIGGAFAIHGLRVIDGEKGRFVAMPSQSYEKDGKVKYSDVFHAITADARVKLNQAVLAAYEERLHMQEEQQQGEQNAPEEASLDDQDGGGGIAMQGM